MSIQSQITSLAADPFIGTIATEIGEIAARHGVDELPSGPSTERAGFTLATSESMGEWDGHEDEAADAFNNAIDNIYRLIDVRHIGSGIFYTTHSSGEFPENWEAFEQEATEAIESWLNYRAWDEFCNNPYGIGE